MARTALIIDDDSRVRRRLRDALEQEGLEVSEQEPAKGFRHAATTPAYAVILLDIVMPEKDGFEYLREIRQADPVQPLIAYTHALTSYSDYAVKLGADAGIDISRSGRLRELVETARRLAVYGRSFDGLA